jgi:hypothetical protein
MKSLLGEKVASSEVKFNNDTEHLESGVAPRNTAAESKVTWQDIKDNKRVLAYCE